MHSTANAKRNTETDFAPWQLSPFTDASMSDFKRHLFGSNSPWHRIALPFCAPFVAPKVTVTPVEESIAEATARHDLQRMRNMGAWLIG